MTQPPSGEGQPQYYGGQPQYTPGHAWSGPPAHTAGPGPATSQVTDAKGFMGSLFDFGFTAFVTPKIVKVIYALIMVLVGLSAFVFVVIAFKANAAFGLLSLLVLGPLFFLIVTALWRMLLEQVMIFFRMADLLQAIRDQGGNR